MSVFSPKKGHEQDLDRLLPWFRERVIRTMARLKEQGFDAVLFEGLRSVADANRNALLGRGVKESMHLFGVAADLICAHHGWACREKGCKFFDALADAAEAEGLVAGWRWPKKDGPHIQAVKVGAGQAIIRLLGPGKESAELRDWWCANPTTEAVYLRLCELRSKRIGLSRPTAESSRENSYLAQMFFLLEGLPLRRGMVVDFGTSQGELKGHTRSALDRWAKKTGVSYFCVPAAPKP